MATLGFKEFADAQTAKWKTIGASLDDEEPLALDDPVLEAEASLQSTYQGEMAYGAQVDKLNELKIKMAVEAYEKRRPADTAMHHYWIKEAGDPEAIGEYVQTGDFRYDAPVYRNEHGLILSRERQPLGPDTDQEVFGWVIGNMDERRPVYGVQSEDMSVPTLGWQAFTAPEPVPIIRYFTAAAASRKYKEKGNRAFQRRDWAQAEDWYSKALNCQMDAAEYAESYAMLFSNRAEVRLRLMNFSGALGDGDSAMKFLKGVFSEEPSTAVLKQKTVIRCAKAMLALKQYDDARRVLSEQRRAFPSNSEMERLLEETALAAKAEAKQGTGKSGSATSAMLAFVGKSMEVIQAEVSALGDGLSELVYASALGSELKKVEYLLSKAQMVEGECMSDLQTVMRTNGGMHIMLKIMGAQWKSNLDGKTVDTYKCQAAASAASIVSLLCSGNVENLRMAADYAHAFFSLLGGCNRKCEASVCELLVDLAAGLWKHCKATTVDVVQTHSIVAERSAAFLSKAALAEPGEEVGGPDAPALTAAAKEKAVALVYDLLACGGRIEKRALRGLVPQLAAADGEGYFTAEDASLRALGELVALKAMSDPQLLTPKEVKNLLFAVQLLIMSGPGQSAASAIVPQTELAGEGATMRYVDLQGFDGTDDGKITALLLQVLSKAMEFRLCLKDRELQKDDFEDAFLAGHGYFVVVPLVQSPAVFAEPALLCLTALAQSRPDNVHHIIRLSAVNALFGLPTPDTKPMPTSVDHTLKTSLVARQLTAKLLAFCVEAQAVIDLLATVGEQCIKELVKLASQIRLDGQTSIQAFHDMIRVFYVILQSRPGPLCKYIPVDMMNLLVEMGAVKEGTIVNEYASAIVAVLRKDKSVKKVIKPIIARIEEGKAADVDEELLSLSSKMLPKIGV